MKQPNEVPPLAEFWHEGDSNLDPAWYYRDDVNWFFLLPKLNPKATGRWCLTVNPPSEMRRVVKHENHSVDATEKVKRSKYHHLIAVADMPDGSKHEVWVDVYDVINAWQITNPAQQHLAKKALQAGDRGHKDYAEDMDDIISSAKRAKELQR